MDMEQDAVWRSFLGTGDAPVPREEALRAARAKAASADEEARSKSEQVELMTAMLQAAEEELRVRSSQLELTNEMLRATEAELGRKEEQLQLTAQMLRKAEDEIKRQATEASGLRKELAEAREGLVEAARRAAPAALPAPKAAVGDAAERTPPPVEVRVANPAVRASDETGRLVALLTASAAGAAGGAAPSVPADLVGQFDSTGAPSVARVALVGADAPEQQRPKQQARPEAAASPPSPLLLHPPPTTHPTCPCHNCAYFVQRWALWLYTGFLVACVGPRPALAPRRRPPYPRRPVRAVTGRHRRTPSPSSPLARIPSLRSSPPHSAGFRVCMLFEMSAQVVPRIDIRGISPGESHSLLDPQDLPWISPAELAGAHCR